MDNPVCKDYAIQHPGPKHTSYEYGTVPVRGLYEYQCTVLLITGKAPVRVVLKNEE